MSIAVPGPKPRPVVVTIAVVLLYLVAASHGISLIAAFVRFGVTQPVIEAFPDRAAADAQRIDAVTSLVGAAAISLIAVAGAVALGPLLAKGKPTARILTWVFGGLGIFVASVSNSLDESRSGISAGLPGQIDQAVPHWVGSVSSLRNVLDLSSSTRKR